MEATKAGEKKPEIIHNAVKVKTLLYLDMKRQLDMPGTRARDIAYTIGANCKSLYVLLARWDDWGLIERQLMAVPYTYKIAAEGHRYLENIGNWFFSGYYSKKRKRRVPGYRGNELKLRLEIAEGSGMVLYAEDTARKELFYIEPPFHKAADFVREPLVPDKVWDAWFIHMVKFPTIGAAFTKVMEMFGADHTRPIGDALVAANIGLYWPKPPAV